ncbi:hypothetical protein E2562_003617 [Oryza meyeriana var. granulata]|uniref:Uncharacterized protein n=1 Tax=Oryza meyeriana var. granulata TaxID=110450 RepID=A0A6G1CNL1_9ORYZ|nr:hypothetical protein E2562_003617 [Oryza meyeriana var. granulata]
MLAVASGDQRMAAAAPGRCGHRHDDRERVAASLPRVASCFVLAVTASAVLAGFLSVSDAGLLVASPSSSSSPARRLSNGVATERARIAGTRTPPSVERELDAARAAIRRAARRHRHGGHGGGEGSNVTSANWLRFFGDVDYARRERVYHNPAEFYRYIS